MSEAANQIEDFIARRDWPALLTLLESGVVTPTQKFSVGGRNVGLLPIAAADNAGDVALYLIAHGADVNERYYGMAPLLDACDRQNHAVIEALVTAGAALDVRSPKGSGEADETALMTAAEKNDLWAVQRLLAAGADATLLTCRQQSAIHYALMFYAHKPQPKPEATEIVNALLDAGCPLLGTEIHFAVHRRDVKMARLLLERGSPADVPFPRNEEDGPRKGQTPLANVARDNGTDLIGGEFDFEPTDKRREELTVLLKHAGAQS